MNDKVLSLILNIAIFIIAVVGVVLIVQAMGTDVEKDPVTGLFPDDTASVDSSVAYSLYLLYGGGILIAGFTLWAIIMNPKKFIPTAIGLAVFGVLVAIGYSMVTIEKTGDLAKMATPDELKWGGLGIQTTYVLVSVALGLIVLQMGRGIAGYFQK